MKRWRWGIAAIAAFAIAAVFATKAIRTTDGDASRAAGSDHGPDDLRTQNASTSNGSAQIRTTAATRVADVTSDQDPDWKAELDESDNLAAFVLKASSAADLGDAAAAWYAGEAISECALVISVVRAGGDSERNYLKVVTSRFATSEMLAKQQELYRRCASVGNDEEFASWSRKNGGKMSGSYWRKRALELGLPLAKADYIERTAANLEALDTEELRKAAVSEIRTYARDVVRSQNPDALFTLGTRLMNADLVKDVTYGFALALAACDLGYDCSEANRRNLWACNPSGGPCPQRTFPGIVQEMLSPAQYASAYALAEEFKERAAREEWDELEKFIRLDGPLMQ